MAREHRRDVQRACLYGDELYTRQGGLLARLYGIELLGTCCMIAA